MQRKELWRRRTELGQAVVRKRRLFLDVRFWNDLCDADAGHPGSEEKRLLDAIRLAKQSGSLICPVEFHLVEELHRQQVPDKRERTLRLVDELSDKTILLSAPERIFLEVLRFVESLARGEQPTAPPLVEMWTRPAFLAGHYDPPLDAPGIPAEVLQRLLAAFEEEWWNFGFVDLFSVAGIPPLDGNAKHGAAERLNALKPDPTTHFKSLSATYWSEVRGTLDAYLPQLGDVWKYMFSRAGGDPADITPEQLERSSAYLRAALYNAAKKRGVKNAIPSLHIGATLYANLQWDKQRQYKSNDLFDFDHAEAALPYGDAFATDSSLASLITRSRLAEDYSCAVLTSCSAILSWIDRGDRAPTS